MAIYRLNQGDCHAFDFAQDRNDTIDFTQSKQAFLKRAAEFRSSFYDNLKGRFDDNFRIMIYTRILYRTYIPESFLQRAQEICAPNTPGAIRIYTAIAPDELEHILKSGLKPRSQFDPGSISPQNYALPDRYDHVYFRVVRSKDRSEFHKARSPSGTFICIDVPPTTPVYNSELRGTNDISYYQCPMELGAFIDLATQHSLETATLSGVSVYDPWTSLPSKVAAGDYRVNDCRYWGGREVVISRKIDPSEFAEVIVR